MKIILKYFSTSYYQQAGWQEKQVCWSEGTLAGMGWNTLVFVRWDFPFIFLSNCSKFHCRWFFPRLVGNGSVQE